MHHVLPLSSSLGSVRTICDGNGVYNAPAALSCINMDTPWKVVVHVKPDVAFKSVIRGNDMTLEKPHKERNLMRL